MTIDDEHDGAIRHRYAAAIIAWDVHEGRDRDGMTRGERYRYEHWRKAGCSVTDALLLMCEEHLHE